ncbi:hypothetical protein GCM10022258_19300 [Aquimarina gracilis]
MLEGFSEEDYRKGYVFFGPTQSPKEDVIDRGISILNDTPQVFNISGREIKGWVRDFETPVRLSKHSSFVYTNLFVSNIKSYSLHLQDTDGNWYNHIVKVKHQKYQVPLEISISKFRNIEGIEDQEQEQEDSLDISRIVIAKEQIKKEDPFKFVVAQLSFYDHEISEIPAKGFFFHELTKDSVNHQISYSVEDFGNSYPLLDFTIFRNFSSNSFWFKPNNYSDDKALKGQVLSLLSTIINKYPFYQEHNIDKEFIHNELNEILKSKRSFDSKLNSISELVNLLSDGHFYLQQHKTKRKSGPVFAKEIGGQIQVVSVFNNELHDKIPLGSIITKVDGVNVDSYLKNLNIRLYGKEEDKRMQLVSKMLYKTSQDSTTLTFKNAGKEKSITYRYDKKLRVSKNFRPIHAQFREYDDWSYFRLNSFRVGDWIRFFNNKPKLEKSDGIIFDLRGNPGGAEVEAFRILSCFLKKPIAATHNTYEFNSSKTISASNVILPNKYLDLSNLKIVILVDKKTACASEIFTSLLKQYSNTTIIGAEKTSGAYASGDYFHLPFNLVLKNNILNKFYAPGSDSAIEYNGIEPDIYVPIFTYKDLFPYEDKVLNTALKFQKHL